MRAGRYTARSVCSRMTDEFPVEKERTIPKDGQVMISMLKDMGITIYEPRVINQMLEFSYRCGTYMAFLRVTNFSGGPYFDPNRRKNLRRIK